jgi:hypothetical protein
MGGEALGLVEALCPSVGECQNRKAGVGWVGEWGLGGGNGFSEGKQRKGITFEM